MSTRRINLHSFPLYLQNVTNHTPQRFPRREPACTSSMCPDNAVRPRNSPPATIVSQKISNHHRGRRTLRLHHAMNMVY